LLLLIENVRLRAPINLSAREEGSMFRLSVVDHVRLNLDRTGQNYTVHAKAAERLASRTSAVRIGVLVLLGIATAAAMVSLIEPGRPFQITAAVATLLAFGAHASYLAIGLEGRVDAHRACANRLWRVCDGYRSLLSEVEDGLVDRASLLQRRDDLSAQVQAAYDQAFALDQKAFESMRLSPEDGSRDAETSQEAGDAVPPAFPQQEHHRA
jgi:hypothetical protein